MTEDSKRLREHGTELERRALAASVEDQPSAKARESVIARVLEAHRTRRRNTVGAVAATLTATVAAAATFALVQKHQREPALLAAEPRASASVSATPRVPAPPAPSGASPFVPCTPFAVAGGSSPLIDDFEDGDVHIPMLEHRAGQWLTFNDGTGSQLPKPATIFAASRIPGGRGESRFGIHSTGGKFTKWGANLSLELNPRRCYDASAYAGIDFWARGRGEIRLAVEMTQVVTEEFGGTCTHDCYDAHAKRIKLTRDFTHYFVRWADLRQQGFGQPERFDARSLYSIQFSTLTDETPFDYWIDDVSFILR